MLWGEIPTLPVTLWSVWQSEKNLPPFNQLAPEMSTRSEMNGWTFVYHFLIFVSPIVTLSNARAKSSARESRIASPVLTESISRMCATIVTRLVHTVTSNTKPITPCTDFVIAVARSALILLFSVTAGIRNLLSLFPICGFFHSVIA